MENVRVELHAGDRRELRPLFDLADDSPSQVAGYAALGEILVARVGGEIVGHAQVTDPGERDTLELKSLAVRAARQRQGIGERLVAATLPLAGSRGALRMLVATAAADTGNLRFYQRQGFRLWRIERDAFGPHTGYPAGVTVDGIPLRDRVILERLLAPRD